MTSERALDQQMALLQEVLDGMADGVVVTDIAGTVLRFNAAAQRLLGKTPAGVPLDHWPETFGLYRSRDGAPLRASDSPLLRAVRGERTGRMEIVLRNEAWPEGRLLQVSASPVRAATSALSFGAFMLLHDITDTAPDLVSA